MLGSLRSKILAILSILVIVSLAGVASSFWMTQQVNSKLTQINDRSVPLQRELAQLTSDTELVKREYERSLGFQYWNDPRWKPRRVPKWVLEVHRETLERIRPMVLQRTNWHEWHNRLVRTNEQMEHNSESLYAAIKSGKLEQANELYPVWVKLIDLAQKEVDWAKREISQETRDLFQQAQTDVQHLRLSLQILLLVVISVSLLILWLGEKTLRPIGALRDIVKSIAERGELTQDHKQHLPDIQLRSQDEVSELAREFSQMATSLLEREKTVLWQTEKLADQNELLKQLGLLNQTILRSMPSLLLVMDGQRVITHLNEKMNEVLNVEALNTNIEINWVGKKIDAHPVLKSLNLQTTKKIESMNMAGRVWAGNLFPVLSGEGQILLLDDVTDSLAMEKRLQEAEQLAAMGRMSAQVAHEVGNPLHSIGLEAEMGIETLGEESSLTHAIQLKQNFQMILQSVERLKKIIQNYLSLSKPTNENKTTVNLKDVIESALATHSNSIQAAGVHVKWKFGFSGLVFADPHLLECAVGNLIRNSIQSFEEHQVKNPVIQIEVGQQLAQSYFLFKDNGPGVPEKLRESIFKPFFTTKAHGTGLGLSFVKKVFEDLGGKFELIPHESSAFIAILPLNQKHEKVDYENIARR